MNWIPLQKDAQLQEIREKSSGRPQLIFKHSTRCSTSALIKSRLERGQQPDLIDFYYLDLLSYRPLSDNITKSFIVEHESPQVLLILDGQCVYDESHIGINMADIVSRSGIS
jgi:bacillithiol system protein YtxJ